MGSLLKLGILVGIVGAFAVGTAVLPQIDDEQGKTPLVEGVIVPTREQLTSGPVRVVASLFAGAPRRVDLDDTPVDVFEPEIGDYRFRLSSGPDDGPRFFVHASAELANTDSVCAIVALPPLRIGERDGEDVWVVAATGRPLAPLRLTPTRRC